MNELNAELNELNELQATVSERIVYLAQIFEAFFLLLDFADESLPCLLKLKETSNEMKQGWRRRVAESPETRRTGLVHLCGAR